jgi:hypothetical protein
MRGLGEGADLVFGSAVGGKPLLELNGRLIRLAHENGLTALGASGGTGGLEHVSAEAGDGHARDSWGRRVPLLMSVVMSFGDGYNARGIPFGSCDMAHTP